MENDIYLMREYLMQLSPLSLSEKIHIASLTDKEFADIIEDKKDHTNRSWYDKIVQLQIENNIKINNGMKSNKQEVYTDLERMGTDSERFEITLRKDDFLRFILEDETKIRFVDPSEKIPNDTAIYYLNAEELKQIYNK